MVYHIYGFQRYTVYQNNLKRPVFQNTGIPVLTVYRKYRQPYLVYKIGFHRIYGFTVYRLYGILRYTVNDGFLRYTVYQNNFKRPVYRNTGIPVLTVYWKYRQPYILPTIYNNYNIH